MDEKFRNIEWFECKFLNKNKSKFLGGTFEDKYLDTYSDYLAKYLKAYKDEVGFEIIIICSRKVYGS